MQTKDDGTHVILPVADHLAVSLDHARLPVMMLRQSDGKMRRDGSSPARPQPSQPVGERGGLHGAPQLFAVVAWRIATKGRMAFSDKEERRRWRSRSESSHRLGRQDKARFLAPGTSFLSVCLHVACSSAHEGPARCGCGSGNDSLFEFNDPSAVAARCSVMRLRQSKFVSARARQASLVSCWPSSPRQS